MKVETGITAGTSLNLSQIAVAVIRGPGAAVALNIGVGVVATTIVVAPVVKI